MGTAVISWDVAKEDANDQRARSLLMLLVSVAAFSTFNPLRPSIPSGTALLPCAERKTPTVTCFDFIKD